MANLAPDGKHILFASLEEGPEKKLGVGLATVDGSAPIAYLDPPPRPTILRDGRWIRGQQTLVYVDTRSGAPNLWTYPLIAGKPPQQLTHFLSGRIFGISLSPDGTKIAFSRGSINSDVVLFSRSR
jgi:Tol biopolymer transport system component